jgi:uncharacterized membrane protein
MATCRRPRTSAFARIAWSQAQCVQPDWFQNTLRIEHTIQIDQPVDDVFSFMADPENLPLWQSGLAEVRPQSDVRGLGARHLELRTLLGKRFEQVLEVTAFVPGERLDLAVVEGPVQLTVRHTFEPVTGGTRVVMIGEGDPGPLFALAAPLMARAIKKQSKRDFKRLKSVLESDG